MTLKSYLFLACVLLFSYQCNTVPPNKTYSIPLTELSDSDYPDNPDIPLVHPAAGDCHFTQFLIAEHGKDAFFDLSIVGENDTISLNNIDLSTWIPCICTTVGQDAYLRHLTIINQEWNRQQVRFDAGQFAFSSNHKTYQIERVDIARNCLNAYLWEVILYASNGLDLAPIHHSWFEFPPDLYRQLFETENKCAFEPYRAGMENWIAPENQRIVLDSIRHVLSEKVVSFQNLNAENYPLTGERKKKFPNIIYPKNTTKIQDFLTDSTLFATFSPPGLYEQKSPRRTQLSLLAHPNKVITRMVIPKGCRDTLMEVEIQYQHPTNPIRWIISGVSARALPRLAASQCSDGWQNPMGFGNHSFYETYETALKKRTRTNPYFSVLLDTQGRWLDSHDVGIDGPLLHWDAAVPDALHVWLLSFERHALVGHLVVGG